MSNVAHPSKVEISPLVVDGSHADCRPVPLVSDLSGCATPTDSDWSGLPGERYRARWFRGVFLTVGSNHRTSWPWLATIDIADRAVAAQVAALVPDAVLGPDVPVQPSSVTVRGEAKDATIARVQAEAAARALAACEAAVTP